MGGSKQSIVNSATKRLLSRDYLLGLPTSWAESFTDEHNHGAPSLFEISSGIPMEKLIDLCFSEPWGLGCFLNKSDILMLIQKQNEGGKGHNDTPITDTFLLGIAVAWGATIDTNECPGLTCAMASHLIDLWHAIVLEKDSISKFLALVAMVRPGSSGNPKNRAHLLSLVPRTDAICLQERTRPSPSHLGPGRLRRTVPGLTLGIRPPERVRGSRQRDQGQARLLGAFLRG